MTEKVKCFEWIGKKNWTRIRNEVERIEVELEVELNLNWNRTEVELEFNLN